MGDRSRRAALAVIGAVSLGILAIPVFDVFDDVAAGKSLLSTLVENVALILLALIVLAAVGWLAQAGWRAEYVWSVAGWTVAVFVFAAGLFALIVGIQLFVQGDLKPLVIAGDGVLVATTVGLLVGIYAAANRRIREGRFDALFENVPNPIVGVRFVEGEPIVERVNPAFETVFGLEQAAVVGEPLDEYIVPSDADYDPVPPPETVPEPDPEDIWERETFMLETDRGRREFIRMSVPVEAGETDEGYGIYIDITDQQHRRERLQVLARTLRHDLRNRLNVITGAADSLADVVDPEHRPLVAEIRSAADRLLGIGERTRETERIVAGSRKRTTVALPDVVREVVAEVEESHGVRIGVELPDRATAEAIPELRIAVAEIVRNAVEHNDADEPTVEVTLTRGLGGEYYELRVADDGPGIDPREHEVVTGDREASQVDHATGLGLWTAYWILRESGGDLRFEANAPRGTVATLQIPRADDPEATTSGDSTAAES